ncbi:hypothetical protein AMTR_s00121p00123900 [Amborella trichopoda]|uniref:Uncharacterized protein n=1 Tax=Amborella trichopoda TaxID=13333 RepID=W1NPJ1_AMBTC|nr:hypothetical protein AMTR_s00121p00123900 [Amborella trichopoda]
MGWVQRRKLLSRSKLYGKGGTDSHNGNSAKPSPMNIELRSQFLDNAKQPSESSSFGASEGTTLGVLESAISTRFKKDRFIVRVKSRGLIVSFCKFSEDAQKSESLSFSGSTAAAYFTVS